MLASGSADGAVRLWSASELGVEGSNAISSEVASGDRLRVDRLRIVPAAAPKEEDFDPGVLGDFLGWEPEAEPQGEPEPVPEVAQGLLRELDTGDQVHPSCRHS